MRFATESIQFLLTMYSVSKPFLDLGLMKAVINAHFMKLWYFGTKKATF